jgi:DNA-binding GntR family transcriptional regulator
MAVKAKARPRLVATERGVGISGKPRRQNKVNLADLAYDKCEELIVSCELKPGLYLSIQDLQDATGVGRTPIHQAVSRLAADTLLIVRPRHGLQIAPIDLARERTLLLLRRDLERFILRLAAERSGPSHRNQLLHISRTLRDTADPITIAAFNRLDRRIDQVISAAAAEPFLEHTLRPLHTIFRRIGMIYHTWAATDEGLDRTIACHLAMLDAVVGHNPDGAAAAADQLIAFVDSMFDALERSVDPALLDCNLEMQAAG